MTTRKQKRTDKAEAKRRKRAQRAKKRSERASLTPGQTDFRFLAFQPLSLKLEHPHPFELSIQQIPCRFALRPVHSDATSQRTHGGTFISVDFSLANETDLLRATKKGLNLFEDFFSGVALVEGATFRDVEPVQIVRIDHMTPGQYTFVRFLDLSYHHWDSPISHATIKAVQELLAHWDGLDSGKRLRRAARQFHRAIGTNDDLAASSMHIWA